MQPTVPSLVTPQVVANANAAAACTVGVAKLERARTLLRAGQVDEARTLISEAIGTLKWGAGS